MRGADRATSFWDEEKGGRGDSRAVESRGRKLGERDLGHLRRGAEAKLNHESPENDPACTNSWNSSYLERVIDTPSILEIAQPLIVLLLAKRNYASIEHDFTTSPPSLYSTLLILSSRQSLNKTQTKRDSNSGRIVLTLEASDGGKVVAHGGDGTAGEHQAPFIEVIGSVERAGVMTLDSVINLGDNLDLTVVDFVVEKWHSPQFSAMMFPAQRLRE
ncbi:hypothetical protein NLI96_g12183 [Meripilus lineatus]|uniref:Uncharacterized protein n=1 Tax=Meripilus lineatus TaxID=2056292 RepID=A0AAD5YCN2_9APHY|nr:hypothetical protein NLI96_g12183 [Physisporinus lineatus]